jgi:hypothetical protein
MGRASRLKHERRMAGSLTASRERRATARYVRYETLLATDRAVRYHNRDGVWWIEVQLAGDQGGDAGPAANRSFICAFDSEESARRTGGSLVDNLRRMHKEGRINTDVRYNAVIAAWAAMVRESIEKKNAAVLEDATMKAQRAHTPSLMDFILRRKRADEEAKSGAD